MKQPCVEHYYGNFGNGDPCRNCGASTKQLKVLFGILFILCFLFPIKSFAATYDVVNNFVSSYSTSTSAFPGGDKTATYSLPSSAYVGMVMSSSTAHTYMNNNSHMQVTAWNDNVFSSYAGTQADMNSAAWDGNYNLLANGEVVLIFHYSGITFPASKYISVNMYSTGPTFSSTYSTNGDAAFSWEGSAWPNGSAMVAIGDTSAEVLNALQYNIPTPSSTISFIGPIASSTLPNFKNWLVQFNVATSTTQLYSIRIDYGTSTSYGYSDTFPAAFQGTQGTAGFLNIINTIKKGVSLSDGTYHAKATLQMVPQEQCPNWTPCAIQSVDTGDITFTIDHTATITSSYFTTSTDPTVQQTAAQYAVEMTNPSNVSSFFGSTGILATTTTNNAAAGCKPAADWTDIGGGIYYGFCSTLALMFNPSADQQQAFNDAVNAFETTGPLGMIFNPASQISAGVYQITGPSSTVATTTAGVVLLQPNIDHTTTTITLIPGDPAKIPYIGGSQFQNDYFNLIIDFLSLFALALMWSVGHYFLHIF